jgi:hypothetical protein
MSKFEASGDEVISFELSDLFYVLSQIGRLGEGIKAEFDLISGRMTWLMISESFIFSAFATAIANYRSDHPVVDTLWYLIRILPFIGMLLTVTVYVAIVAALSAIDKLKRQRDRMMAGLPAHLRIDLISARSRHQWWGNVPAHVLPPTLFLVWALTYVFTLT